MAFEMFVVGNVCIGFYVGYSGVREAAGGM